MDEQTGVVLADSSLLPTNWTRTGLGTAYGPWCRRLYTDEEKIMDEGRVNTTTRVNQPGRMAGQPWPGRMEY